MANNEIISIAIPAFNSSKYIELAFKDVYNDPRIDEIIVVDDNSGDFTRLQKVLSKYSKVTLFKNAENLGGFWNKQKAVGLCKHDWVVVLDADNRLLPEYLDSWYSSITPDPKVIYCPSYGRDTLNYQKFEGEYLTVEGIKDKLIEDRECTTKFLNTGNYIVNRNIYIKIPEGLDINKSVPCAIAFNYLWLTDGNMFFICPGMRYVHTVGFGRFWKDNKPFMQPIVNNIINSILSDQLYVLP